jgi:tetratricopeptide (TPR) repeat protein
MFSMQLLHGNKYFLIIFGIMEQKRFLELLNNPHLIAKSDVSELLELKGSYPYFQTSYLLLTLFAYKNKNIYYDDYLKLAALYATNRTKLRSIILDPPQKPLTEAEIAKSIVNTENQASLSAEIPVIVEEIVNKTEKILPAIEALSTEDISASENVDATIVETLEKPELDADNVVIPAQNVADSIIHTEAIDNYRIQTMPFESIDIELFNQHVQSLIEGKIEDKKGALDAIDLFLKNQPKLNKNFITDVQNPIKEDLSEKFTSNSEEFFSESLAKIYAKQGKKQKAIETYRKLMLTNPQKSAYFASKITELENLI